MTRVSMRILALAAVASLPAVAGLPLLAQQPSPRPHPSSEPSPQAASPTQAPPPAQTNPEPGASQGSAPTAAQVPATGNAPEVANPQLRPVTGELENKLDTKDAKTGDTVVVKITETATIGNGVEIPKGSEIKGHIVDVAPKGPQGDNARVTIQFDQAQLKSGQSLPIRSVIQSVASPGTATSTEAAAAGGSAAATPNSPSAATGAAGVTGSTSSRSGASGSSPAGSGSAAAGSQTASPEAGGASGAPAPGTVVATRGNLAIKTTAIPGVLLIGDVNGRPFSNAAGALLGAKQDVRLDSGTVMVVAIMTAPPTVGSK